MLLARPSGRLFRKVSGITTRRVSEIIVVFHGGTIQRRQIEIDRETCIGAHVYGWENWDLRKGQDSAHTLECVLCTAVRVIILDNITGKVLSDKVIT